MARPPSPHQVHVDEEGNPSKTPGKIAPAFILKHCPVEIGTLYNLNEGRKTLQNVFALDLFDNVQVGVCVCVREGGGREVAEQPHCAEMARSLKRVPLWLLVGDPFLRDRQGRCSAPAREPQILPRQNEKDPSRVDVEVMVREKPTQTADVEAEWGIAPGEGLPPYFLV